MSRIRTIKPEFWTSEQVVECSPIARLLFIGMWNFADDAGNLPASYKTIKMQVLPADDVDIKGLILELIENKLVSAYEVDGRAYLHITGWKHQKISNPAFKYPSHESGAELAMTREDSREVQSARQSYPPEGKGRDIDIDNTITDVIVSSASRDADHANDDDFKVPRRKRESVSPSQVMEIGSAWNDLASCFGLPQIDTIDGDRRRSVDARARELSANYEFTDPVAGFCVLFGKVRGSPFLRGQINSRDGRPAFRATFDWCISPKNFRKIMEGNYENQVRQQSASVWA